MTTPSTSSWAEYLKNFSSSNITFNYEHILYTFLWAAEKNLLKSINIIPSGDNEEIQAWSTFRHAKCIKSFQQEHQANQASNIPTSQGVLDLDLNRITKVLESHNAATIEAQKDKSSSKGFSKLYPPIKNLILNASAPNEEIPAANPSSSCDEFFKQSSHGSARLHFIRTLKHSQRAQVEVLAGVITSIFNGGFTRTYDDTPSNFSIFSFPEKRSLSEIHLQEPPLDCIESDKAAFGSFESNT